MSTLRTFPTRAGGSPARNTWVYPALAALVVFVCFFAIGRLAGPVGTSEHDTSASWTVGEASSTPLQLSAAPTIEVPAASTPATPGPAPATVAPASESVSRSSGAAGSSSGTAAPSTAPAAAPAVAPVPAAPAPRTTTPAPASRQAPSTPSGVGKSFENSG